MPLDLLSQPLLTLAIPTWNRAPFLSELLECLLPQITAVGSPVELLISDNASTDATPQVVASFEQRGLPLRYLRNQQNVGADSNFLQCFRQARGHYVWVLGDDDLLTPDALPQIVSLLNQGQSTTDDPGFDLVYLSSFGFSGTYAPPPLHTLRDKLGRFAEVVTSGEYFLEKINALIGLISVVIVNRQRLLATPHPPLEDLRDTNLIQTGWIFPLLHRRARILYVWQRLIAYRSFNSTGWGVCEVFGVRLGEIAARYFRAEPSLALALQNGVLRYWLPDAIFGIRTGIQNAGMPAEDVRSLLQPGFRSNWRYWVFVWPVVALPLPLARVAHPMLKLVNRLTRAAQAVLRNRLRPGQLLRP